MMAFDGRAFESSCFVATGDVFSIKIHISKVTSYEVGICYLGGRHTFILVLFEVDPVGS
jgi:hypothetical protein